MGADFWNFLGNDGGTYDVLLGLYRDVGAEHIALLDELRAAIAARRL